MPSSTWGDRLSLHLGKAATGYEAVDDRDEALAPSRERARLEPGLQAKETHDVGAEQVPVDRLIEEGWNRARRGGAARGKRELLLEAA
jgi:hypothetical protein